MNHHPNLEDDAAKVMWIRAKRSLAHVDQSRILVSRIMQAREPSVYFGTTVVIYEMIQQDEMILSHLCYGY